MAQSNFYLFVNILHIYILYIIYVKPICICLGMDHKLLPSLCPSYWTHESEGGQSLFFCRISDRNVWLVVKQGFINTFAS